MSDLIKRLRDRKTGDNQCEGWENCDCSDDACEAIEEIGRLGAIVEKLLDERDMLALNFGTKETGVCVMTNNDGEVVGVAWPKPEDKSASDNVTHFPKRFLEHK